MIVGVGTDIVEVERIAKLLERHQEAFAKRVLSEVELLELPQHTFPVRFLAKRWALKEAVSKALGTGFTQGVSFQDMTIGHTPAGQPTLQLQNTTLQVADRLGITHWSISVSDEKNNAVAFVVAEARTI